MLKRKRESKTDCPTLMRREQCPHFTNINLRHNQQTGPIVSYRRHPNRLPRHHIPVISSTYLFIFTIRFNHFIIMKYWLYLIISYLCCSGICFLLLLVEIRIRACRLVVKCPPSKWLVRVSNPTANNLLHLKAITLSSGEPTSNRSNERILVG